MDFLKLFWCFYGVLDSLNMSSKFCLSQKSDFEMEDMNWSLGGFNFHLVLDTQNVFVKIN